MIFWLTAIGLAGLATALVGLALLRGEQDAEASTDADSDVRVYRDQLAEVERDVDRGVLTRDEAARVRVEVSRRLLEADRAARARRAAGTAPRWLTLTAAVAVALAVIGGGLALYMRLGAPGYPDLPLRERIAQAEQAREARPSQEDAETRAAGGVAALPRPEVDPAFLDMMDELRAALETRTDDVQGFRLLARNEAGLGNFAAAADAQERVIELEGADARASAYNDLAEYMVLAAGGYVSPEAEQALTRALQLDPRSGRARYYLGLMQAQVGRPDLAFRIWRGLLEEGPETAPWIEPVRAQIGQLAQLAGVRYAPPAPARGPSAADVEAAGQMSIEERGEMIRGMVSGLAERLASEGGPPEDWARLVGAYGVLGETGRARAIWEEAQQVFAGSPEAVETIRAAARQAGVAE